MGWSPPKRSQDLAIATIHDYAQLFGDLVGQLVGLKETLDDTLEQEGKQVSAFIAMLLLSRLHHRDPEFPLEGIHQRIILTTARMAVEAAVAPHVTQVVSKLERHE